MRAKGRIELLCSPQYGGNGTQPLCVASATAVGGRQGHVRSSDGVLDVPLALPKELGGAGGHTTNPEQLFAAGYAACVENALMRVARKRKVPLAQGTSSVTAHVGIGRETDGYFRLTVTLDVAVKGRDRTEIAELARVAHAEVCPYSHATRGNIDVQISVLDAAASAEATW